MRIVFAATVVFFAACNTPSVPLPPPDLPSLTILAAPSPGEVIVQGAVDKRHANVRFYIYDQTAGDGVITPSKADGSFVTSPFGGANGDSLEIYYETQQGDLSQELCTELQLNVGLISMECL